MTSLRLILLLALVCIRAAAAAAPDRLELALRSYLDERSSNLPGKVSITLGKYPHTARLLACSDWQISLPPGARPWGKVSVHARCMNGSSQSLYVSAEIRVIGPMLQAVRHIPAGTVLSREDFTSVETEISKQAADILLSPDEALGQTTRLAILTGRPLQRRLLREELAIHAGQNVKLTLSEAGITVSNEGKAINNALLGQLVRVRLANGRIIRGKAGENGRVTLQN